MERDPQENMGSDKLSKKDMLQLLQTYLEDDLKGAAKYMCVLPFSQP